jgi:hypothetical protein
MFAVTRGKNMTYLVELTARKPTTDRFGYEKHEKLSYMIDGARDEHRAIDYLTGYLPTIGKSIIDYRVHVENWTHYGI